jgi:hypothetical protein
MWLVPLTAAIARGSRQGQPVSRQKLAEDLGLRLEAVAELVGVLEEDSLVLHTTRPGSEDVGLMLALPAELVPLDRVVALAARRTLGEAPRAGKGWNTLAWLHDIARKAASEKTVADLL